MFIAISRAMEIIAQIMTGAGLLTAAATMIVYAASLIRDSDGD